MRQQGEERTTEEREREREEEEENEEENEEEQERRRSPISGTNQCYLFPQLEQAEAKMIKLHSWYR